MSHTHGSEHDKLKQEKYSLSCFPFVPIVLLVSATKSVECTRYTTVVEQVIGLEISIS